MTLDAAAGAMSWRGPKLSKIEGATQAIRTADVGALLTVYGVEDDQTRHALEALAREAGKRGWWQTYSAVVSPTYADYISLETDADSICAWSPLVIPGLLQTAAYARETIAACDDVSHAGRSGRPGRGPAGPAGSPFPPRHSSRTVGHRPRGSAASALCRTALNHA